jgi:hypothetical protein
VDENWKSDLRAIPADESVREIAPVTRKVENVDKEIAVHPKRERLELILSQNERLTTIRDGLENKSE